MSRISDKREKIEKGETVVINGDGRVVRGRQGE